MSEYYFINQQIVIAKKQAVLNEVKSDVEIDPVNALRGSKLPVDPTYIDITLAESSGDFFPDMFSVPFTLMSDKIKTCLDSLGIKNIDFYPVRLLDMRNKKEIAGYWFANILGRFKCVDEANSDTKINVLGNLRLKSFRIDESKSMGAEMFRLDEEGILIIISERVYKALSGLDLQGVIVRNTKDYDGYGI